MITFMIGFILICMIILFINLYMGLHVLFINPKHKTHITYFLLSLILSIGILSVISMQLFEKQENILLLYKHDTSLNFFIMPLTVILILQLSKLIELKKYHYVLIFLPAFVIAVKNSLTTPYATFMRYGNSWRLSSIDCHDHFIIYFLYGFCAAYLQMDRIRMAG